MATTAPVYESYEEVEPHLDATPFEYLKMNNSVQTEDNWEAVAKVVKSFRKHKQDGTLPTTGPYSSMNESVFFHACWREYEDQQNYYYHFAFVLPARNNEPLRDVLEVIDRLQYTYGKCKEASLNLFNLDMNLDKIHDTFKIAEELDAKLLINPPTKRKRQYKI